MDQKESKSVVYIVDDDPSVRESMSSLFRSVGLSVELFETPAQFLQHERPQVPSCLVLDIRLPGVSGLDFQAELAQSGIRIPIIFVTGHGDIPMTVKAMKAGAVEFLTKPFRDQDIIDAVHLAIERDRVTRESDAVLSQVQADYETLTEREREIMALVTAGLMNKQIAGELGLSEVTVKMHRGKVTRKMGARSLADLVRMAETIGIKQQAS